MKKILSTLISIPLLFTLNSCGTSTDESSEETTSPFTQEFETIGIVLHSTYEQCLIFLDSLQSNTNTQTAALIEYTDNEKSCSDYGLTEGNGCITKDLGSAVYNSCVTGFTVKNSTESDTSSETTTPDIKEGTVRILDNLVWEDTSSSLTLVTDYYSAKSYCENLSLENHTNFRLPTKDELVNLAENSFDVFDNISEFQYWTSEEVTDVSPQFDGYIVWVKMSNGNDGFASPNSPISHVRCVE